MIIDHQYFHLPDPETKVWRYLSFTKFVSLLHSRALHFARADRFDDPFEGTVPEHARESLRAFLAGIHEAPDQAADEFLRLAEVSRLFAYISCWHANPAESDAMWRLYAFATEGVAVQSTVGRLRQVLDAARERIWLGSVWYVDFETVDPLLFVNGLTPFIFKRPSFEHEREIRGVIWMEEGEPAAGEGESVQLRVPEAVIRTVPVDLNQLIEKVVVSPVAPRWFAELVEAVTRQHGLEKEVVQSRLYEPPARREPQSGEAAPGGAALSISRDVVDYLHQQHLQYTELQIREQERLAQRQSEAIAGWLDGIERDLEAVRYTDGDEEVTGRRALWTFAREIPSMTLAQAMDTETFHSLYFISGRIDNAYNELMKSALPDAELELLLRRIIFFYTEALFESHVALASKAHEEAQELPDHDGTPHPVAAMRAQFERMHQIMTSANI